jgi:tetratricopeptide (TPR) repeat protein
MNNIIKCIIALLFISLTVINAQSTRGLVNDGVDNYEENNYAEAEVNFKKGVESDMENFESRFNLGDAIYKQGRYEEALEEFKNSMSLAQTEEQKAKIFHNLGNTFLKSQKLQESIGAYKEALKINPNDLETKYNLSYALKQMQNQQNNQQNQQNQDQQDQNQDQNQDEQDQNQDQENKDQEEKQDQQQQNQDQQQNQQQNPEPKDEISKDEAQRILDALKNNEAELQKKMREQKTKKSNVEKDW